MAAPFRRNTDSISIFLEFHEDFNEFPSQNDVKILSVFCKLFSPVLLKKEIK